MSKTKLLLDVADSMRALADSIQTLADAMIAPEPSAPVPEDIKQEEPMPPARAVTLEQVRAVLAEKSQAGFTAGVRELLEKHGAAKLSQIDPGRYAALLADAESLR